MRATGRVPLIPRPVWVLGFVSMFMDISSEMVHSLLPVFIVTVLHASAFSLGLIEGVAEATALVTRVFSGTLSDALGRRKPLATLGYAMGTLSKPLFAVASSVQVVFSARFIDRIGKGIRGAPRDALVADMADEASRGASFGIRQSLDSVGAVLGPLGAVGLMALFSGDIRMVFWAAVVPGVLAVTLIAIGVREPAQSRHSPNAFSLSLHAVRRFPASYWLVVVFGSVFTLARFSEAFLLLRVQGLGVRAGIVPVFYMIMNAVYALSAYPSGAISDRLGRRGVLGAGIAVLAASNLVMAVSGSPLTAALGVAMWGLHLGLTQGILASLVADTSPEDLKGSAFGLFSLASGAAMLAASLTAGLLWDLWGPQATFIAGACFSAVSLVGFAASAPRTAG